MSASKHPVECSRLRVLIVILSLDREPWRTLEAAQRDTWAHSADGVEVIALRGITKGMPRAAFLGARRVAERLGLRAPFDRAAGRIAVRLPVTVGEGVINTATFEYWIGTSAKTHACLKYLAEHESFDYLVRTNSSTYVHVPRLLKHLRTAPRQAYYAGADQGEQHAQGTLIVLSRDVVDKLADDSEWDYSTVDDVALGAAAMRAGCALEPLRQVLVPEAATTMSELPRQNSSDFIYRLKNRTDRLGDAERMHALHAAFREHTTIVMPSEGIHP